MFFIYWHWQQWQNIAANLLTIEHLFVVMTTQAQRHGWEPSRPDPSGGSRSVCLGRVGLIHFRTKIPKEWNQKINFFSCRDKRDKRQVFLAVGTGDKCSCPTYGDDMMIEKSHKPIWRANLIFFLKIKNPGIKLWITFQVMNTNPGIKLWIPWCFARNFWN